MLFSSQLSFGDLAALCRVLRHNLQAGLSVLDVFRQQSLRGTNAVRPVAGRIAQSLKDGETLSEALKKEEALFPTLFLALVGVGEETGHMPEIFRELEIYFALEQKLRRQFISQSILPVLQFILAIFVISGLIWILGVIAESRGNKPITLFGLTGLRGALTFFFGVFGTLTGLFVGYRVLKQQLRHLAAVEAILLRVPVLGGCLEAFALSRLALVMQLTLDSGMTIMKAMRLSLTATGNSAIAVHADEVAAALKKQQTLGQALKLVRPLPTTFIDIVASAEEGGRVPEMMRHQAEYYQEEASRRLTALARVASGTVWLVYAVCMVFAIFSIAKIYIAALN